MTKPKVHFIGIGGIGTSALARWFLTHNWQVSGSDAVASPITQKLKKQGIRIYIGHQTKNLSPKTELVIYSAAVPPNNPELKKAKKLRITVKSYAQALAELNKQYKTLAVSGAHGKSTTTALLSLVLIKAGFDPTVIIGTKLKEFGGSTSSPQGSNFRNGKGNYLVLEADEYQGSFLNYSPFAAIITNIDREHLDYYKNLRNIKNAFLKFISNIQPNGILVVNQDDKNLFSLKNKIQKISQKKKIKIFWYGISVNQRTHQRLSAILKIVGEHNLSNALAVYTLAKALKIKDKDIFSAIGSYCGSWRRMEYRGTFKVRSQKSVVNCQVFDDYAHHPTEIKATLTGIAKKWPKIPLICVFQPHQVKRLSLLFKDFIKAFDKANALVLLPIYRVRGRDSLNLSQNRGCCNENKFRRKTSQIFYNNKIVAKYLSEKLAEAIQKRINSNKLKIGNCRLKTVTYLPHPTKLPQILKEIIKNISVNQRTHQRESAIIVMMGAGDIYKITDKLIQ